MIIKQFESECYGKYNYECVGMIRFSLIIDKIGIDEYMRWAEKYHPKNFFRSFSWLSINEQDKYSDVFVFVPTERANLNWFEENKDLAKSKKMKKLPIIQKENKVKKWLDSLPDGMLTPDIFKNAKTYEDLMLHVKKNID